jgi:hypothetical protein
MAKSRGSMNIMCITRIDPHVETIAIHDGRLATFKRHLSSFDRQGNVDTLLRPTDTKICELKLIVELAKVWQAIALIKLDRFWRFRFRLQDNFSTRDSVSKQ